MYVGGSYIPQTEESALHIQTVAADRNTPVTVSSQTPANKIK